MKKILTLLFIFSSTHIYPQTVKILFDATKAETAGNADWIIDADQNNLGWYPNAQINSGDESNPQQYPSPAQSTITVSTPETYWQGALSNWGIDCVKYGYEVETLPYNGSITYNNVNNPQDLSNFKIFVVCEPNILFTAAQKTAILNFVQNGGSLFMIADHDQSDRNGDGYDSPAIWNDLMNSNPFGLTFNLNDFSQTSTSIITTSTDSVANGPYGQVTQVLWSGGTDMTINTSINATVKGVVFRNGSLNNITKVMFAYGRYGNGKFAAMGDSSPADDGSGDVNDILYNGYVADANGNHRKLIMNATIWLASNNTSTTLPEISNIDFEPEIYFVNHSLNINNISGDNVSIEIMDISGKLILNHSFNGSGQNHYELNYLNDGVYLVTLRSKKHVMHKRIFVNNN